MEYLVDGTKEYRAEVALGTETDTYDSLGQVTGRQDPSEVKLDDIIEKLGQFQGVIQQVPPMYSALKRKGKRLYELARAGIEVEREPRRVEVFEIEAEDWSPPVVTLKVRCGRGFYMRSLAYDLGRALGCGAHLKGLARLRTGPFKITEAMSLADAEQTFDDGTWRDALHAPDAVLGTLRAFIVGKRAEDMIRDGRPVPSGPRIPANRPGEECRVYTVDGRFVAIVVFDAAARQWRPSKVFSLDYADGPEATAN
jgi:tRNA pseudouridine55 synthase